MAKHLRDTNTREASGLDDITSFLMKQCAEELPLPLMHLKTMLQLRGLTDPVKRGSRHPYS